MVGWGGGGALTFRKVVQKVQKRESLDFRSPEAGISGEEVDLWGGTLTLIQAGILGPFSLLFLK